MCKQALFLVIGYKPKSMILWLIHSTWPLQLKLLFLPAAGDTFDYFFIKSLFHFSFGNTTLLFSLLVFPFIFFFCQWKDQNSMLFKYWCHLSPCLTHSSCCSFNGMGLLVSIIWLPCIFLFLSQVSRDILIIYQLSPFCLIGISN